MIEFPDWPQWAMRLMLTMGAILMITLVSTSISSSAKSEGSSNEKGVSEKEQDLRKKYGRFRSEYMVVYLIIMLADWMQGTHMYTLYLSYGVNVAALFLTGFLSGAIFAPFLGSAVDKFGRKKSCCVYCILEIIINTLEHSTNFEILLFGRVLGGISTNLLFSAFESWMTTEHRKRGFPDEWISSTYSVGSVGNGVMAILAGLIAQLFEDRLGPIGPFQAVIVLTALALLLILRWEENYGESSNDGANRSLRAQFYQGWATTYSDSNIWKIGLTQALSEGAMYTFVFIWVPTLLSLSPPGGVPTGCVFSAMMTAITIGGILFTPFHEQISKISPKYSMELSATLIYTLASISMAVPAYCLLRDDVDSLPAILTCFMAVEVCIGMFSPAAGTLRSKYVPDALNGAILNIFRLPLNAAVVTGTYATDILEAYQVFLLVSFGFMSAAILQASIISTGKVKKE